MQGKRNLLFGKLRFPTARPQKIGLLDFAGILTSQMDQYSGRRSGTQTYLDRSNPCLMESLETFSMSKDEGFRPRLIVFRLLLVTVATPA